MSANRRAKMTLSYALYVYVVGGTVQLSKRVDKSQEQAITAIDHVGVCMGRVIGACSWLFSRRASLSSLFFHSSRIGDGEVVPCPAVVQTLLS